MNSYPAARLVRLIGAVGLGLLIAWFGWVIFGKFVFLSLAELATTGSLARPLLIAALGSIAFAVLIVELLRGLFPNLLQGKSHWVVLTAVALVLCVISGIGLVQFRSSFM